MTSFITDSEVNDYLKDLEELANSDLCNCDQRLVHELVTCFEEVNHTDLQRSIRTSSICLQLFVEDLKERRGPFKIICSILWTGKKTKEKIQQTLHLPMESLTLMTHSCQIKDDETLQSVGITKQGDVISVFLKPQRKLNRSRCNDVSSSFNSSEWLEEIKLTEMMENKLKTLSFSSHDNDYNMMSSCT